MNEVLRFGAEYMFGQRVNANDADGIANRLQFMAMYTFKEVVV
jgi:nitrous oxidase accessory protein NosD